MGHRLPYRTFPRHVLTNVSRNLIYDSRAFVSVLFCFWFHWNTFYLLTIKNTKQSAKLWKMRQFKNSLVGKKWNAVHISCIVLYMVFLLTTSLEISILASEFPFDPTADVSNVMFCVCSRSWNIFMCWKHKYINKQINNH